VRSASDSPPEAVADRSQKHDIYRGLLRPVLLAPGIAEVERIVMSRGGLLPRRAKLGPIDREESDGFVNARAA
jgi:hypothetical protein